MLVYEVAEKLGIPSKEILKTLKTLNIIGVTHHRHALSEEDTQKVFRHIERNPLPLSEKTKTALTQKVPEEHPRSQDHTKPVSRSNVPSSKEGPTPKTGAKNTRDKAPAVETPPLARPKVFLVKQKKEPELQPSVLPPLSTTDDLTLSQAIAHGEASPDLHAPPSTEPLLDTVVSETSSSQGSPTLSLESSLAAPTQTQEERVVTSPAHTRPHTPVEEKSPPASFKKEGDEAKKQGKGVLPRSARNRFREPHRDPWKVNPTLSLLDSNQILTEEPAPQTRTWQDFIPTHKRPSPKLIQKHQSPVVDITKPRRKTIKLYEGMTVKEFSSLVGIKISVLISKLMSLGKMMTANQLINMEDALLLADDMDIKVEQISESTEEEILRPSPPDNAAASQKRVTRPPVITIMGHVDHGKTSLLDAIRKTKVQEGESGGITQHIGAYTVTIHNQAITFLDTPGHEAFTAMRARGAKITDIVVLVVAADDGVMPQTIEAINHAQAANVPILVAINKIDIPEAQPERVKSALTEYGLVAEAWGGKTLFVEVSAKKKMGLEHFLEMILLQAEIMELTGKPDAWMEGVILEAKLSRGRGPVATVLIQQGTLRVGDAFVAGVQSGRVRALINDMGEQVKEAPLSMPVEVIGFSGVPAAGDTFMVTEDERVAKDVAQERLHRQRIMALAPTPRATLHDFAQQIQQENIEELRLVIKADVNGSMGALSDSIEKLATEAVKVRILHKGVGGITESDVLLASSSQALVIGFHVRPDPTASEVAEREHVDIRLYEVIYDVLEDVKKAMQGMLAPTYKEKVVGRAEVREVFQVSKVGTICGCYVHHGVISRGSTRVHLLRDQVVVYDGKIASLRRFKEDVKEVSSGFECGISIEHYNDVKVGDILEVYIQEEVATLLN